MKVILFLFGLSLLLFTSAGCDHEHHEHQGGAYEGTGGYWHGEYHHDHDRDHDWNNGGYPYTH